MKYYFITQDKRLVDVPQIINWYQTLNIEEIKMGTYHKIPNRMVLQLKNNKELYFPEILFHPCLMISKKIKNILCLYEPTMRYKEIILLDTFNEKTGVYYIPYLEELDCLAKEKTKFGNFQSIIEKGAIYREKLDGICMFYVKYNQNKYYVVRHDLLESMLRRDAIMQVRNIEIV